MSSAKAFQFADLELSRRLERAEARANAEFVEARASAFPASGAQWIEVAGAYAMFDGVNSPCTQTFGLGIFLEATDADLAKIESFYRERGAVVFHEVSPLADLSLLTLMKDRGYHPIEFTSVMFRQLSGDTQLPVSRNKQIRVRLAGNDEHDVWARTAAKGWSEFEELGDFMLELAQISAERKGAHSFLAELEDRPIATGSLFIFDGVALLAGASTIPEARNQGAQLALLESRLRYAIDEGCDLAMIGALPGSASQRNAERQGFRIAYTRVKWQLDQKPTI
jgi:GNAT superfamily N-acetyltransferase